MCGTTAREASQVPRRLTAIMRSHSSISISSKGERDIGMVAKIAALFTRMSIRPNASTARAAIASTLARSATSVRTAIASKPCRLRSTAAPSAAMASISAITIFAPSLANPSAYALPMPCPPPVMIATFPAKRSAMLRSSSGARSMRRLSAHIVPRDLGPGRAPHAFAPEDVLERGIERADAVRHAAQVRVQGDRHDAARFGAFFVEHVELAHDHVAELRRGAVAPLERRLVVDLGAVGHGHEPPSALELHHIRLIVVHPVADVLAAFGGEKFERVPGFLQPRAQPAGRPRAGRFRDRVERAADGAALLARPQLVEPPRVALVVPHELPVARLALVDDLGVLRAQVAVQSRRAAHAVAVEHFHEAKDAHAVAVIARGPCGHVGRLHARAARARRYALGKGEELDIRDHPERDARPARPFEPRPAMDRRVGEGSVCCARLHRARVLSPSRCRMTSPACSTSAYLWCMSKRFTLCEIGLRSKQHSSTSVT